MADSGHASAFFRYTCVHDFVVVPRQNYVRPGVREVLAAQSELIPTNPASAESPENEGLSHFGGAQVKNYCRRSTRADDSIRDESVITALSRASQLLLASL
jgi:hypothetical protein